MKGDITKEVCSRYPKPDEDYLAEGTKNRLATFVCLSILFDPKSFQHLWLGVMCEGYCVGGTHMLALTLGFLVLQVWSFTWL